MPSTETLQHKRTLENVDFDFIAGVQHAGLLQRRVADDRRDLADFLIEAGPRWVPEDADWIPHVELDSRHSLRDRTDARRALAVFPGVLLRLSRGIHTDASVNFFEDGYDAAQARLKQWERLGPTRLVAARNAIERLET